MPSGNGKMPIGAIHVAAGALAFEVEEDVRQRRPLQQIVVNLEAAGTGGAAAGRDAQDVMPRRAECRKIRLPVSTIAPVIHVAGRLRRTAEYDFARGIIDQCELSSDAPSSAAGDQRYLGRGGLVADLIHQDTHLRRCQRCRGRCTRTQNKKSLQESDRVATLLAAACDYNAEVCADSRLLSGQYVQCWFESAGCGGRGAYHCERADCRRLFIGSLQSAAGRHCRHAALRGIAAGGSCPFYAAGCFACEERRPRKALPPQIIAYIFPRNRALQPNEIAAGKLTRINYAFANIQDGRIVTGSPVDEANFATLVGLKQQNPSLQVLVSVGGWLWSGNFSDTALTKQSRSRFIDSVVEFVDRYKLDGLDIDWEYPGMTGAGNRFRPEDKRNYTLLLKELRARFDREQRRVGRPLLLSVAAGSSSDFIAHTEMNRVQRYLDTVNLMAYDYYEPGSDKISGNHAPLYTDPADPKRASADQSVQEFEARRCAAAEDRARRTLLWTRLGRCRARPIMDSSSQECRCPTHSRTTATSCRTC